MINHIFKKIDNNMELEKGDLIHLLRLTGKNEINALFERAYETKIRYVGKKVFFRGIIEFSNICEKDCFYCGIRKGNDNVERFLMNEQEIIEEAEWIHRNNYASLVLQSGERRNNKFIDFVERILVQIKERTNGQLRVTLSLGEQDEDVYRRWLKAGAHRYLLRIETSNKALYEKLHPNNHDYERRLRCLASLKETGYQVGTGVMIGLPSQSAEDLANDIIFFRDHDIDMIGMGPYLPHTETPLGENIFWDETTREKQLQLGLKMIAVTRLYLKDVNIAATTALQALDPEGREMGLLAGANVIMPNVTDTKYRTSYQLYDNKPCINENSTMCQGCLASRIMGVGESIAYNEWGDSVHYRKRIKKHTNT